MWKQGPEFLREEEAGFETEEVSYEVPTEDHEVKKVVSYAIEIQTQEIHPIDKIIKHCSSWYKVKRIIS